MTARIITNEGVKELSDREFYARIFGHPPRTKEQKAAQWQARCEKYADMIERGGEWAVPPPCLRDARRIVQERAEQQLTETASDPLLKRGWG